MHKKTIIAVLTAFLGTLGYMESGAMKKPKPKQKTQVCYYEFNVYQQLAPSPTAPGDLDSFDINDEPFLEFVFGRNIPSTAESEDSEEEDTPKPPIFSIALERINKKSVFILDGKRLEDFKTKDCTLLTEFGGIVVLANDLSLMANQKPETINNSLLDGFGPGYEVKMTTMRTNYPNKKKAAPPSNKKNSSRKKAASDGD